MFKALKIVPKIIFKPGSFFSSLKEQSIGDIYKFWVQLSLVNSILGFFINLAVFGLLGLESSHFSLIAEYLGISYTLLAFSLSASVLNFIFLISLGFAIQIASSLVLHVFIKLFGGSGFKKTLTVSVLSSTPALLLSFIPIISSLASLYSLVICMIGLSKIHKMSIFRVIIIQFIIAFLIILLVVGLFIAGSLFLSSSISDKTSSTVSILDASCSQNEITVVLSNDGTKDIKSAQIDILLDDNEVQNPTFSSDTIELHSTVIITFDGNPGVNKLKISSPSNNVSQTVYY